MPSNNDQFEHGRLPLKPLPYKNRNLANCNEILIDYGENANYHIYIVHHNDDTKYIDITDKIVHEMLPEVSINGDQFTVTINGIKEPQNLSDILSLIYKNYIYANDPSGFDPERDKDLINNPANKNVLLQTSDGTIMLPITSADNVYDKYGNSLQDRLDTMHKLSFSTSYVYATIQNQVSFDFVYPFEDYSDFLEIRIGTTYIDKTRYIITKNYNSDKHYKTATINFIDESIELGRRIDFLWIYNTVIDSGSELNMSGNNIANSSIPIDKLDQYSDSFTYPSSNSVATSMAVHNLYKLLSESINSNTGIIYITNDTSKNKNTISIDSSYYIRDKILYITMASDKLMTTKLTVIEYGESFSMVHEYPIITPDGNPLNKGFRNNQLVKIKISDNKAILLNAISTNLKTNRYIYTCKDQEYDIPFNKLNYCTGDIINVYRNGVRLFQDLDYSINNSTEIITLYVRTEEGERIVFESIGI